jgi:U4/U6.U5 tri-snRNP component SNU23
MSGKAGAYGTSGGGDTDFRKTWDRDEMAQRAKDRDAKDREEGKERYEAKLAGKTYRRRASTPDDLKQTEARSERIDWSKMIGKQTLTSAAAAVGKRGRGAGAYCQACDLTFKCVFIATISQPMTYANSYQGQHPVRRAFEQ